MPNHAEVTVQIKDKYGLTIDEAVEYFGIGQKKLRKLILENQDSDFFIENGTKYMIKPFDRHQGAPPRTLSAFQG